MAKLQPSHARCRERKSYIRPSTLPTMTARHTAGPNTPSSCRASQHLEISCCIDSQLRTCECEQQDSKSSRAAPQPHGLHAARRKIAVRQQQRVPSTLCTRSGPMRSSFQSPLAIGVTKVAQPPRSALDVCPPLSRPCARPPPQSQQAKPQTGTHDRPYPPPTTPAEPCVSAS